MAFTVEQIKNEMITSVHGRRLGLDSNAFLTGPKDLRKAVEDITTTAATTASNYGLTRVLTSGSSQTGSYTVEAPVIGTRKMFFQQSTSTGTMAFKFSGGASVMGASVGTAGSTVITLLGQGANACLEAVTTALWLLVNAAVGSSAGGAVPSSNSLGIQFTTST